MWCARILRFHFDSVALRRLLQLLLFATGVTVYFIWTWSNELGDFGSDSALYLLVAQHFSPWSEPNAVAAFFANQSPTPPLYPLMLAALGGAESILVAHILTTAVLMLAFLVFYLWLRDLRLSALIATCLAVLVALVPGMYYQALSVMSESLYLFFTLVCLAAITRYERHDRPYWLWIAACAVIGAMLTRSAGIALLAAFFAYVLMHRPSRWWNLMLVALLPVILWELFRPAAGTGYLQHLAQRIGTETVISVAATLLGQARILGATWTSNFTPSGVGAVVVWLVGLLCLSGAAYRTYRGKLDGFYVAAYVLMILIWPYPAEAQRFLIVLVPVLLAQGVMLLALAPSLRVRRVTLPLPLVAVTAMALIVIPALFFTFKRFTEPLPRELAGFRRSASWYDQNPHQAALEIITMGTLTVHMRRIPELVPTDQCVYATKSRVMAYIAKRISVPPPLNITDSASFPVERHETTCNYFYMTAVVSPSFPVPFYPLDQLERSLTILSVATTPGPDKAPLGIFAKWSPR